MVFNSTEEFIAYIRTREIIVYAHNGGKFDWMFLLNAVGRSKMRVIGGRIVSMKIGKAELRDSFSIIPVALKELGGKKDIEIWKLEKICRDKHRPEILEYLFHDCKSLWEGVTRYREVAGTKLTIASNALAFAKKLGIDPGETNYRFDKEYRQFFYGGRCECFQPGTHKGINLLDIRSAYPFAMMHEHATGDEMRRHGSLDGLTREQIQRSFIILECFSRGALPLRTKTGLIFPHEYNEYKVTGWEYLAAMDFNLLSDISIKSVRVPVATINFIPYVTHWFDMKAATNKKTDPMNYTIAKIMMNSLYGKTAQNPANYFDYQILPAGSHICRAIKSVCGECDSDLVDGVCPKCGENDTVQIWVLSNHRDGICNACGDKIDAHGWQLHSEFEGREVHRRESMWKHKISKKTNWHGKGLFINVATGASITGFTRAHLLRTMHTIGIHSIIYSDTDGLVCKSDADLSRVPFSDKLGDWEHEDTAIIGHFAGKKLYGIALSERHNKGGVPSFKIACKGSRLFEKEVKREIEGEEIFYIERDNSVAFDKVKRVLAGEEIIWRNHAPTFSIDGNAHFMRRKIKATATPKGA